MAKKTKQETYRVWIEQVNQTYLDVVAQNEDEAKEKGYRKWRREDGHSCISYVEKQDVPNVELRGCAFLRNPA